MNRKLIKNIAVNEEFTLAGFVHSLRSLTNVIFIELRDVSGMLQIVINSDNQACFEVAKSLKQETVIEVQGTVTSSNSTKYEYELVATSINVLSSFEANLPIQVNEKQTEPELDTRMNYRWLDLRKPQKQLIFKAWTAMEQAFVNYCTAAGYMKIHSPKLLVLPVKAALSFLNYNILRRKRTWHSLHNSISRWLWQPDLRKFLRLVLYLELIPHLQSAMTRSLLVMTSRFLSSSLTMT